MHKKKRIKIWIFSDRYELNLFVVSYVVMKVSEKLNAFIFKTKETIGGMWIRNNAQWNRVNFSTHNSLLIVVIEIQSDLLQYKQAVRVPSLLQMFLRLQIQ